MIPNKKELKKVAYKIVDIMGLEDLEYFIQLWGSALDIDAYTEEMVHTLQQEKNLSTSDNLRPTPIKDIPKVKEEDKQQFIDNCRKLLSDPNGETNDSLTN